MGIPFWVVVGRLYERMYKLLTSRGWRTLGPCGRRIAWSLPGPSGASPGWLAFLSWAVLWGPLRGVASLRDEYGVMLEAYADRACRLLGGIQHCWRLSSASRGFESYLEHCLGLRRPGPGEADRLEEALRSAGLLAQRGVIALSQTGE